MREGGLADAGPPAPREMAAAKIVAHASEMELPGIVPILARIAGDVRVAASSFWDEPKPPATGALEAAMKEVEDGLKDLAAAAERWGVTIKDRDRERAQERVREILQSLRRAIELCCALRPEDTIQPVTSTYSYFSGFTEPRGYKALCELDVVERERDGAREKRSFFTKLYGEEAAAKDVVIELRAHFAVLRLVTTEEKHPAVGKLRTQAAHLFKPGGLELPLRVVRAMLSASLPYGWNPKPTKDVVGIDALDADGSERSTAPLRDAAAVRELVDRLVPQRPVGMRPFLQLADDGVRLADRWLEEDVGAVCAAKGLDRPAAVFLWLSGELQDAHVRRLFDRCCFGSYRFEFGFSSCAPRKVSSCGPTHARSSVSRVCSLHDPQTHVYSLSDPLANNRRPTPRRSGCRSMATIRPPPSPRCSCSTPRPSPACAPPGATTAPPPTPSTAR